MSIQQSQKKSDLEKRLKILRQQVYGKRQDLTSLPASFSTKSLGISVWNNDNEASDIANLYKDLSRILILSLMALGAEITLFVLVNNNFIKLGF